MTAAGPDAAVDRDLDLDRCAAYVAARDTLVAVHDASLSWPSEIALEARRAAVAAVATTAEGLGHGATTAARRRCIREALGAAIALAATLDVARAVGVADAGMARAQHHIGRTVALLGLLLHASANPAGA
jgi:hypothetical protein